MPIKIEKLPEKEVKDIKELYKICSPAFTLLTYFPHRGTIFKQLSKAKKKLEEMGI